MPRRDHHLLLGVVDRRALPRLVPLVPNGHPMMAADSTLSALVWILGTFVVCAGFFFLLLGLFNFDENEVRASRSARARRGSAPARTGTSPLPRHVAPPSSQPIGGRSRDRRTRVTTRVRRLRSAWKRHQAWRAAKARELGIRSGGGLR